MNAVIFPGQGSQYVGMGKSLYDNFDGARRIFSKIDSILGFELSKKCFFGPQNELKDTFIQQLAILAASIAAYEAFKAKNLEIDCYSGLSLGEYSCLYSCGVLSLDNLVILVKERAQAMQEAAQNNPSCMLAVIGLTEDILRSRKDLSFYIANINHPHQMTISLSQDKKQEVKDAFISLGAKVVELEVSGGFHSPFMEGAKEKLKIVIDSLDFSDAKLPIVSNFTSSAHTKSEEIKDNLVNQLTHTVLWQGCVESMFKRGVNTLFELGPSRILKGLVRKINRQLKVINIEKKEDWDNLS